MTALHFADNTVLIHFGLIDQFVLLERLLNGQGTWTSSVRIECLESSEYAGLGALATAESFLGDAAAPSTDAEYLAIDAIREELRVPGDGPHKHLGEAETLALIQMRSLDAQMITDDTGAMRVAAKLGIRIITSAQLLLLAARVGLTTAQECWDHVSALQHTHGRFLPGAPETYADVVFHCSQ